MEDIGHDEAMAALLRDDPGYAIQLLNSILANGEADELQIVLRQMVLAAGGESRVADLSRLGIEQLHFMSSPNTPLALWELLAVLKALGLRLTVQATTTLAAKFPPEPSKAHTPQL
jgi:DNA-binding phage protein